MDLWIRSKDRKKLIKAYTICLGDVIYDNDEIDILVEGFKFGRYKEERALEILDEIEKKINYTYNKTYYNRVYNMPEE